MVYTTTRITEYCHKPNKMLNFYTHKNLCPFIILSLIYLFMFKLLSLRKMCAVLFRYCQSVLSRDFNTFSADCLKGQRGSGEEKARRRTAESVTASTATRPTVKPRGASVPASATACFLCPSTTEPTRHTDVCPTCISAEPSELELQHSSINPTDWHGAGGPLRTPLNWASPGSESECGHHPARVRGAWDWPTPTTTAHWRRCVSKIIYSQIHQQPTKW